MTNLSNEELIDMFLYPTLKSMLRDILNKFDYMLRNKDIYLPEAIKDVEHDLELLSRLTRLARGEELEKENYDSAIIQAFSEKDKPTQLATWIDAQKEMPPSDGYYLFCNKGCLPFVGLYTAEKGLYIGEEPARAEFWMMLPKLNGGKP